MTVDEVLEALDATEPGCTWCRFSSVCPDTQHCIYDDVHWYLCRVPEEAPEKPRPA